MLKLTKSIFVETGFQWANVGAVLTEDGMVLIDCPVRPTDSRKWQKELQSLSPLGLRYLITTDYHGDHSTGAAFIEGVTYIAPQKVYEEIVKIQGKQAISKNVFIETLRDQGLKEESEEIAKSVTPVPKICFEDSLVLHLPPLTFEIRRLGGHTPACSVIYIPEEKVLFSSDVVINSPTPGMRDAHLGDWINGLSWIESLPLEKIVPGHGEICGKELVRKLRDRFTDIRESMKRLVKEGKSKTEAAGDSCFEKFYHGADPSMGAYWSQQRKETFRAGLEKIYDEVKAEKGN